MLTIDEAEKLIQADIDDESVEWDSPLGKAYMLSFEALKRIKKLRGYSMTQVDTRLPGETIT